MNDRRMLVTVAVSLGLHLAAALTLPLLPRVLAPALEAEPPAATVELVMEEHKGDARPDAQSPDAQSPDVQRQEAPSKHEPPTPETPPAPIPPVATEQGGPKEADREPLIPKEPVEQARLEPPPPPEPPPAPAPIITLHGTDSPSDAFVEGPNVVPAAQDAVFHNRPPEYPVEAARRGQGGTVVVAIRISPAGMAVGADVIQSSGYVLLDRAAREAVMRWRFLPEVRDGRAVASGLTMRFVFDNR